MEDRRKVLFTNGMSNDFMLIITDAPKEKIEAYCYRLNKIIDDGGHVEPFDTLKAQYYVKELLDSEIDDREDAEIIGWVETYDLCDYYTEESLEDVENLKSIIHNLITLLWEDNNEEYASVGCDSFVEYVCKEANITQRQYKIIMELQKGG